MYIMLYIDCIFFFFKQKTAYEFRISNRSSDVCSSDLRGGGRRKRRRTAGNPHHRPTRPAVLQARCADAIRRPDRECRSGARPARPASWSEEGRDGKECVSKCRSRWTAYHTQNTH